MAIITLNNNSLSGVTALPAGVGGKVLQILTDTFTGQVSSSSATHSDTGLEITITPNSSLSKFLCLITHAGCFRNGTAGSDQQLVQTISGGATTTVTLTPNLLYSSTSGEFLGHLGSQILMSPATSSNITYKT